MARPQTPLVTVDVIIEMIDRQASPVVLVERRHEPLGWALPGGFVDVGETLEAAAKREVLEETGLSVRLTTLLGCYSDPARDPRGHTVSVVYVAQATGRLVPGDDAKDVAVFDSDTLPPLAFDHPRILADYKRYRTTGETTPLGQ